MTKEERIDSFSWIMESAVSTLELKKMTVKLTEMGFFDRPASLKYHGTESGDLFRHSAEVTESLIQLTERLDLKWERRESPYLVGMLHDLCKCELYRYSEDTEKWEYNNDLILPGHGEKSVILAQKLIRLTEEEIACIRWHMGAFDEKENWKHYSYAVSVYPNVLYTHTADMIASQIHGI